MGLGQSFFENNIEYDDSISEYGIGQEEVDFPDFDIYTKHQLINYIKTNKFRSLVLSDDFCNKMESIELNNKQLIPMCFELYDKMFRLFGNNTFVKTDATIPKKKVYFVKPKFDVSEVKKTVSGPKVNISKPLTESLIAISVATELMRNGDITNDEFLEAFNTVLTKKDMMGITKRMLKDSPSYIRTRFINEFNNILNDLTKVDNLSIGKASYMYKANKHGSTNDINSFRQLIAIPTAVNHLHRILTLRLSDYMIKNKYIDTNIQKGGISGQKFAIFEQFFKVRNVIKQANKKSKSCAVLFLDISNAFGNVNLENLYKILHYYNVDQKFINYLKTFYTRFEYYADINQVKTETFKWDDGLLQGCPLSPFLFAIALNYVLTYIDTTYKQDYGYVLDDNGIKILLTAFVDDICIICKDMASLEIVYGKLKELLNTLGLPINMSKCAIISVNDTTTGSTELQNIQKVNNVKYLGEYISKDGSSVESYIQFIRFLSRRLAAIDKRNVPNSEKIKMFTSYISPWMQRKTMAMYDIDLQKRLKIIAILKQYLDKWGYNDPINVFSNVMTVVNYSTDSIISKVKFEDDDFDTELEDNIEVSNYILKDTNINLTYDQIDDEFQLDIQLEEVAGYD
ncbi:reverse transcriptase [Indivirus ILV1]|uniref:Reverse transcriptase n=1 Tax=Indivirus ILV1 TaxID=1977633 RepID=A0A1V0SEK2_9VIRU|nr:reverse transcriptase [Indivirus ILV1]